MLLIETHILPLSEYFSLALKDGGFEIEACETYQKRSFRNRYRLANANGVFELTIPLQKGKNNKLHIRDVAISYDDDWKSYHLKSIKSAYGNAPFFAYYFEILKEEYGSEPKFLFDLNTLLLNRVISALEIPIDIHFTGSYTKEPRSSDYRNQGLNTRPEILVSKYPQVFEHKHGFVGQLSILDMMMNVGPESINYL